MSQKHTTIANFRSLSDGIIASAILAQQDNRPIIAKHELSLTLKRVAPALGIKGTAYHILDILLGLVHADDFQEGNTPIVAISNQRLAEYTQHTTRTVTRGLKQLVEAGILAYKDSPTGRRFIDRNRAGQVIQAYGLDFTPACFNLAAFRKKADAFQKALNAEREAKRSVTRLARAILDLSMQDDVDLGKQVESAQRVLDDTGATWHDRADAMKSIYQEALTKLGYDADKSEENAKMSPAHDTGVVTILNTSYSDNISNKELRPCSNEQVSNSESGQAAQWALRGKPRREIEQKQLPFSQDEGAEQGKIDCMDQVSIGLVQTACKKVQTVTGCTFGSWQELMGSAQMLKLTIGLSDRDFGWGVERQGNLMALVCLAVIVEKALRDPELISHPAAYFKAMIDRAEEGNLNLVRSLHGLRMEPV